MTEVDVDLNVNLNDTNTRNGVPELVRPDARRRSDADAHSSRVGSSPVDVNANVNGGVQVHVHVELDVAPRRAASLCALVANGGAA